MKANGNQVLFETVVEIFRNRGLQVRHAPVAAAKAGEQVIGVVRGHLIRELYSRSQTYKQLANKTGDAHNRNHRRGLIKSEEECDRAHKRVTELMSWSDALKGLFFEEARVRLPQIADDNIGVRKGWKVVRLKEHGTVNGHQSLFADPGHPSRTFMADLRAALACKRDGTLIGVMEQGFEEVKVGEVPVGTVTSTVLKALCLQSDRLQMSMPIQVTDNLTDLRQQRIENQYKLVHTILWQGIKEGLPAVYRHKVLAIRRGWKLVVVAESKTGPEPKMAEAVRAFLRAFGNPQ